MSHQIKLKQPTFYIIKRPPSEGFFDKLFDKLYQVYVTKEEVSVAYNGNITVKPVVKLEACFKTEMEAEGYLQYLSELYDIHLEGGV